jgi:hypothetical protein
MSGADSPEIAAAYELVRDDKDETNWLLISYASKKGSKVELTATGTGGLAELAEKLDPAQAQYAYVRVTYANDSESTRTKFIFVSYIGENCPVMRKVRPVDGTQRAHYADFSCLGGCQCRVERNQEGRSTSQVSIFHPVHISSHSFPPDQCSSSLYSISVEAREPADLDEDSIVTRLRKAGGADYNGTVFPFAYIGIS